MFIWVWFFSYTMPPTFNSVLFGSLVGGAHLFLVVLRFSIAIMYISHMASKWILHFSSPTYLSFAESNLNNVGMKALHPNIK